MEKGLSTFPPFLLVKSETRLPHDCVWRSFSEGGRLLKKHSILFVLVGAFGLFPAASARVRTEINLASAAKHQESKDPYAHMTVINGRPLDSKGRNKSVVALRVETPNGVTWRSGVRIGTNCILTAASVVDSMLRERSTRSVLSEWPSGREYARAETFGDIGIVRMSTAVEREDATTIAPTPPEPAKGRLSRPTDYWLAGAGPIGVTWSSDGETATNRWGEGVDGRAVHWTYARVISKPGELFTGRPYSSTAANVFPHDRTSGRAAVGDIGGGVFEMNGELSGVITGASGQQYSEGTDPDTVSASVTLFERETLIRQARGLDCNGI